MTKALSPTQAKQVLKAYAQRQAQATLLNSAFPKQRDFIDDPAKLKAALCTRRAGKSFGIGLYLIDEALKTPGCTVLYVALTRESANRTMVKDVLKTILRSRGIRAQFNKVQLSFTFDNGSVLYLLGVDASDSEKEKLLGQKYKLVVVDEAGSFSTDLRDLIYSTLKPAVADYRGTICLVGTPKPHRGFFHDVTQGKVPGWSVHRWNAAENPHMEKQWAEELADFARDNPTYLESDEFKRDYLGEWVIDEQALVYRYLAARNTAPRLPEGEEWLKVVGVDLGFNDETAFVVAAFSEHRKELYFVEAYKEAGLDFTAVAKYLHHLIDAHAPYAIVIDGANKQGVEEMRQRHELPLESTPKHAKADHIRLMNADLLAKRVQLLPMAKPLSDEWVNLVWDERALAQGIRKEHASCPNHLSDAALYAWRRCFNYASREREKTPENRAEAEVEAWWEKQEGIVAKGKARPWFEDGAADPFDADYLGE